MPPACDGAAGQEAALRNSRPLRFLAMVLLLWAGMRIALVGGLPGSATEEKAPARQAGSPAPHPARPALIARMQRRQAPGAGTPALAATLPGIGPSGGPGSGATLAGRPGAGPASVPVAFAARHPALPKMPGAVSPSILPPTPVRSPAPVQPSAATFGEAGPGDAAPPATLPPVPPWPADTEGGPRKWIGSAWLLWREKAASAGLGSGGQLGGAQAGIRVDRLLGGGNGPAPLSLYGRLSSALRTPVAPEAALGIAVRPLAGRVPLSIGLERRIALDREARNAFAAILATGLNPTRLGGSVMAEGYMQTGLVGLSRTDAFVDGRLALTAALDGGERTGAGLGLSGGAQPGISRLDIGPVVQLRRPLDMAGARILLEWRQRIAGGAAPGSGPAITLASDF